MKTLLVLVAIITCFSVYAATDVRSGAWTAEINDDGTLQMTIFRHDRERPWMNNNIMGFSEPLPAFSGLTKADAMSNAANVTFELRKPSGTITFDGRFSDGTGAGHYRFTPNQDFIREMESLGYTGFSDDKLLVFATTDFTPQIVRDLRAMGYTLTQKEVEEVAIFKVTAELLRDYARLGYANLSIKEAVNFRIGRVDAEYINAMRALGYTGLSAHQIADMAIIGVKPAFVREMQSGGLTNLTTRELTDLKIGRVSAERINEYRKLGYANLSARQLSDMGIHGVTPQFIQEFRALGYDNLSVKQLIDMKIFGVTPDYVRKLREMGYSNVPVDKMMKLRMSGLIK